MTGLWYLSVHILRSPWSYLEGKEYNLEMCFYCRKYNSFKEKTYSGFPFNKEFTYHIKLLLRVAKTMEDFLPTSPNFWIKYLTSICFHEIFCARKFFIIFSLRSMNKLTMTSTWHEANKPSWHWNAYSNLHANANHFNA